MVSLLSRPTWWRAFLAFSRRLAYQVPAGDGGFAATGKLSTPLDSQYRCSPRYVDEVTASLTTLRLSLRARLPVLQIDQIGVAVSDHPDVVTAVYGQLAMVREARGRTAQLD